MVRKKKPKEKKRIKEREPKKKALYINVSTFEHQGGKSSAKDDGPWSGYDHTVIEVNHWGPVYFTEDGKGYDSHMVHNSDEIDWAKYEESQVWIVYIRYSDGGTFGRTDGYFNVEFVTDERDKAVEWMKEHKDGLKTAHSGYFESLEDIDITVVEFRDAKQVEEKRWF